MALSTATSSDPQLIELLYRALASPYGIAVASTNPVLARTRLYATRTKLSDPDLAELSLSLNPLNPQGELFIAKRRAASPPKGAPADAKD